MFNITRSGLDAIGKESNSLPVPVKKGELKTPFSLVDKAIYLNNKKDVKAYTTRCFGKSTC